MFTASFCLGRNKNLKAYKDNEVFNILKILYKNVNILDDQNVDDSYSIMNKCVGQHSPFYLINISIIQSSTLVFL